MRSLLAAALAFCLWSLAPAGALARPDRGGCSIEILSAPAHVGAGEAATLTGSLTCATPEEGAQQMVSVYQHTSGTRGSAPAGTATTGPAGEFHFDTEPLTSNSAFTARFLRARSRRVAVKVVPVITLSGPSDPLIRIAGQRAAQRASAPVVFSGTVSPLEAGARVVLQRESASAPGDWRRIGLGVVGADGSYSISHLFSRSGTVTIRTVVRRRGQMPAASEPLTYQVAQRQRPRLTIEATPDAILYGQSLTIHGTLAGGAQASVTLLAQTRAGSFQAVEARQTDGAGSYEFAAQTPLTSTYYEVVSGKLRSARLFGGVRPLLSAAVSSASVESGESVTFSGTLTPSHSGRLVLLERRMPSGVGYRTVATLMMGEGSEYSFERPMLAVGQQSYRIKVPRDGGLQATASEPLDIEVTPAAGEPEEAPPGGEEPSS